MGNRAASSALCVTTIEHGLLLLLQIEQQRGDRLGGGAIEIACRLVAQQQPRAAHQRAGQRDALLLAARQLARQMRRRDARARPDRRAARAWASLPASAGPTSVGTSTFSSTLHCGSRQWSWKTNPISLLRNAASSFGGQAERIHAAKRHRPGRRRLERAENVKKRALAASRRSHDRRSIAGRKRQRNIGQHRHIALRRRIRLADAAYVSMSTSRTPRACDRQIG